jgi:ketosteroid isomerase-like protein
MVSLLGIVMDGSAQNAGSTREDEETIRKITGEMTDRFNKHDAKAATRMHMPDADFVALRGELGKGAAEIEMRLAAISALLALDHFTAPQRSKKVDPKALVL